MFHKIGNRIFSWIPEDEIETQTLSQIKAISELPFIYHRVAVMPDCHYGVGASVGSCIPTKGAIIPAAVGTDIGCGMTAVRTNYCGSDLPKNLAPLRESIEARIPLSSGRFNDVLTETAAEKAAVLEKAIRDEKQAKRINDSQYKWRLQLGTLGSGNHFIELVLDENDAMWIFLHSGSRGVGSRLADRHIKAAKKLMERYFITLPDPDMAYLPEGTDEFHHYYQDMRWAQRYAVENRREMVDRVVDAVEENLGPLERLETIDCSHNITESERFGNDVVLVSRKGAIGAHRGEMGLIPGSMGTRSYVVRGLGNRASFCTAPHGAGRRMSRRAAKDTLTMADFDRLMDGIEVLRTEDFIDELPPAYKDIDVVMERSKDLVEVVHTFRQVVNIKGTGQRPARRGEGNGTSAARDAEQTVAQVV